MSFTQALERQSKFQVVQRRELGEFFGFETRNKYAILGERGEEIAFAAEQQKGFLGFLMRQWLGHWRTFDIFVFDGSRRLALKCRHPFRFFFQRLEIDGADGRLLGVLQQRFSIFSKCFDVLDASGRELLTVRSPLWSPWTFAFQRDGKQVAVVRKRWSGLFSEALTDADRFGVQFEGPLSSSEKCLVLAAALFVDLRYFEKKASSD